ncbi:MAG: AAA family ATPase [Gammaproteobacteria bacterium]|jgi:hypothetical protein
MNTLNDMTYAELQKEVSTKPSVPTQPFHRLKLNVVDFNDFLAMNLPIREDILKPWLPTQGLAMIYAPRGIGKTHVALEIAYVVASGGSFLNWQTPKPRGVLYLDGEMPAKVMQERLKAIESSHENKLVATFNILTPDLQEAGMPDLSTPSGQVAIEPFLKNAELIIIDNISTLCRYGKENESESWLPIQDWALRMRASGRSVLFIHHAGKTGNQRGTSKREDVLDTVISLVRPDNYDPTQGAVFHVNFEKARNLYGDDIASFEAQLITSEDKQEWTRKVIEPTTYEKVVELKNAGCQQQEIAEKLKIHKSSVSKYIKRANSEGLLIFADKRDGEKDSKKDDKKFDELDIFEDF